MFKTLKKDQELLKFCGVEGFGQHQMLGRFVIVQEVKYHITEARYYVSEISEDVGILREPLLQVWIIDASRFNGRQSGMPKLRVVTRSWCDDESICRGVAPHLTSMMPLL